MIDSAQVIDQFLCFEEALQIKDNLLSDNFPWYFSKHKVKNNQNDIFNHQFVHMFFYDYTQKSDFFFLLIPILKKLNAKSIVKIKANVTSCTDELVLFDNHTDVDFTCKTAVYYVNENNGYTQIRNEKVLSVENRILIFDSHIPHFGTTCTDASVRCVINFNYFD